jgi:uncharacterized protein YndB with AHSA1/START domain
MSAKHILNESEELTVVHVFNAPKKLVFNAFAQEEALAAWWGPVECKNTVLKLDFKTGGNFHYKMVNKGTVNYGRFTFGKIQPYDLLEFVNSFSDKNGNIIRAPFDIQLPLEIFYRLTFTETKGKTTITLTGQPIHATQEEITNFKYINENVQKGFGATFNKLASYLHKIQPNSSIKH